MQLKDRPSKTPNGEGSDTVYIRGFPRTETDENVLKSLSAFDSPVEYDLTARPKSGEVWARYKDANAACSTIQKLHHTSVNGSILSVKYELGLDESGKRIVDRSSHTTVIRRIGARKEGEETSAKKQKVAKTCVLCVSTGIKSTTGYCNCTSKKQTSTGSAGNTSTATGPGVSYTSNSICVNEMEYPFPSGMYLTRVIELTNRLQTSFAYATPITDGSSDPINTTRTESANPLLAILTDTKSMGNKYGKEISEAMAMVDAVQRAISLLPPEFKSVATGTHNPTTHTAHTMSSDIFGCNGKPASQASTRQSTTSVTNQVRVYVLGDGKRPLCAAALCLHLPGHYSYYSVDPLMMPMYSCQITQSETSEQIIVPCEHFGAYQNRFFALALMSQDFKVPVLGTNNNEGDSTNTTQSLSIVVSCHSHAPLQEFWERLQGPKIAITMACCADYGALYAHNSGEKDDLSTNVLDEADVKMAGDTITVSTNPAVTKRAGKRGKDGLNRQPLVPILEFDDFEVYSPKRAVKIYFDL